MADVTPYLQALESPDVEKRIAAIEFLALVQYDPAIPHLRKLLRDVEPRVRAAAARALGDLRAGEASDDLQKLLSDPFADVREAAVAALSQLETRRIETPSADRKQSKPSQPSPSAPPVPTQNAVPHIEIPVVVDDTLPGGTLGGLPVPAEEREEAQEKKKADDPLKQAQDVQFSAYYPRDVQPDHWYALTAYIFKSFAAEQVVMDAQRTLGGLMATVRRVVEVARHTIPHGTPITATPYLPGFQFNPPTQTIGFFEDWQRLDFKLRAVDAPLQQSTNGILTFTVEGIIVADVPLSIYVGDAVSSTDMVTITQKLYKAIFCSYSHKDSLIVQRVERAYKILGFDFLRDVSTLKSGQTWNEGLQQLIDQADIFQLFWSQSAAESDYVQREWRYALGLDRDETNFIRPVYWEEPMPAVPDELSHIHFAYEPTLDD